MAITWGNTNSWFRLGIETTVSNGVATLVVYGQTTARHEWCDTLHFSGDWSGSKRVCIFSENGRTQLFELHRTTARFTGSRRYTASVSYWGGSSSVTATVAIHPPAPTNVRITGGGDRQVTLAWTNPVTYSNVKVVQRAWYKGERSFRLVKTLPGSPTSTVVDLPKGAGFDSYQWKLIGITSGYGSDFSNTTAWFYTTPDTPTGVRVSRIGDTARVTWDNTGIKELAFEVYRNGTRIGVTTLGSTPVAEFTDTTVGNGVFTYTVRAGVKNWDGTMVWGPLSKPSNELVTIAPPGAPVDLSPDLQIVGANAPTTYRWKHNPVDASEQSAARVQFTPETAGTPINVTVGAQQHATQALPAGKWTWSVRTKGAHAQYGPAATATVTVISRPTATITTPGEDKTRFNSRQLRIRWDYHHESAQYTQSKWEMRLLRGRKLVEEMSGVGRDTEATFTTELEDRTAYTVQLVVYTQDVASTPVEITVVTRFQPPSAPVLSAAWEDAVGSVALNVRAGTDAGVPTESLSVQASDDDGLTWRNVAQTTESELAATDAMAKSNGVTVYRARACASSGACSETLLEVNADSQAVWISAGAAFTDTARLPYDPEVSVSAKRERSAVAYEGRTLPVAYASALAYRTVKAGGRVWEPDEENASLETLHRVAQNKHPVHLYRDPTGQQVFGIISDITTTRESDKLWKWAVTLEETERGVNGR